jgi:(heptosyl)LPS beta-1,4-glucosyltransferase
MSQANSDRPASAPGAPGAQQPVRVAAIVLTFNEERHIADCLATLQWVDERIVFDSFSTDRTVEIARACGVRVIQNRFQNFAQQRNAALAQAQARARADWVFFVDADERCTDELAREIRAVVGDDVGATDDHPVWAVPRDNYLFGKLTRGAGWFPDFQARLFHVGHADFDPAREVHEVARFEGSIGQLSHTLTHYNYVSVAQFHAKQRQYAQLDAGILFKQSVRPKPRNYVLQPLREFRRRFFTLRGYRDGWHGLRLCGLLAYYNFDMYRRLARLWHEQDSAQRKN